jgi:hypothetical protein
VKEKAETDLFVAFLGVLQVTAPLTADRKVKREGSHDGSPHASGFHGGAWSRYAATAPQFLRASSAVPGLFRDLFVIFTCFNMYLNFS